MTWTDLNDPDPMGVRIRVARFGALAFLKLFGFAAVVSPWRTIYIMDEYKFDKALLRHELAHIAQMDRDGWFTFWRQCLWWTVSPGYEKSPYEIEARSVEDVLDPPMIRGYWLNWGV